MNQDTIDSLCEKIINPVCARHIDNPYATFEELRSHSPFVQTSKGLWVATGYRHTKKIMLSKSFGRADMYRVPPLEETLSPVELMRKAWMLYCDPPKHTQIKQLSMDILNKQLSQDLTTRIESISEYLMAEMCQKGAFDLVEDYAYPLPLLVIAELLGVPKEDRDSFKIWSAMINKTLEPCCSIDEKKKSDQIVLEIYSYFEKLIASGPRAGSMLEDLVSAEERGELTKDEVIYTAMLLLIAGHETTSSMTALGMLALLKSPDRYQELRNNPDLIEKAVDELLRYDAPVQMARRIALEDIELLGDTVKKGDMVMGVFGAANHDPKQFERPSALEFGRNNTHLAFGMGTHFCLGTSLAKKEGRIVFKDLVTKLPTMVLTSKKEVLKNNVMLRGLESLEVKI